MNETKIQDLDELKLYLQNIVVDDFEGALNELQKILKRNSDVIGFKARYSQLKKDITRGELTKEQERVNRARLVNGLTGYIEDLKERHIKVDVISEFTMMPPNIERENDTRSAPTTQIVNAQPLVALLIFADDSEDPLGNLKEEEKQIQKALLHFKKAGGNIEVITLSSVDELFDYFTLYKGQIGVIHYGGHASGNGLQIEGSEAQAKGLAALMGTEPNLQFVFLNGCATAGQVKLLQNNNIRTVLATAVPVSDSKASNFAIRFYQNLTYFGGSNTLQNAFDHAKAYIETTQTTPVTITKTRGFITDDEPIASFNWALYEHPNSKNSLTWKLPKVGVDSTKKLEISSAEDAH